MALSKLPVYVILTVFFKYRVQKMERSLRRELTKKWCIMQ